MRDNSKLLLANYNHLGSQYPYYYLKDTKRRFFNSMDDLMKNIPQNERVIDPVGLIEILNCSYLLGNRTLLIDVKKHPWMAYLDENEKWAYFNLPNHGNKELPVTIIAKKLKEALKREMISYIENVKTVGILLSGGMDSRIVAGIIRELQISRQFTGDVVGITWGIENCRDVAYALEITKRYKWDFINFPLNPELLKENIIFEGNRGAEISPIHLHAMIRVRELKGIDAILAGSYGDGIGRAEYSGRNILDLKPILYGSVDRFGLIKRNVVRELTNQVVMDAYEYKKHFSRDKQYQYCEIEQQMHYLRTKLQTCMNYISEKIPLYQLFTAPGTFGFMWSLSPNLRNNQIYEIILKSLPGSVYDIPWSRTGKQFNLSEGKPDKLLKNHHLYGLWLRRDLKDYIVDLINNGQIQKLNIFNEKSLENLINVWPKLNTVTNNALDEIVSWLASLSIFVERYSIKPYKSYNYCLLDTKNTISGFMKLCLYKNIKNFL